MSGTAKKSPSPAATYLADMVDTIRSRAVILDRWQPGTGDELRTKAAQALAQIVAQTDLNGKRKAETERR